MSPSSTKFALLALLLTQFLCDAATQLLKNGNFESDILSTWKCYVCTYGGTSDAHSGKVAFLASYRTEIWSGPGQHLNTLQVKVGHQYLFKTYAKLRAYVPLTKSPELLATLRYTFANDVIEYETVAFKPRTPMETWFILEGIFTVRDYKRPLRDLYLFVEGPVRGINIMIDDASLTEIYPTTRTISTTTLRPTTATTLTTTTATTAKPLTPAERRIESIRKGNLTVSVSSDELLHDVEVKFEQLRHEFGFGSGVDATLLQTNAAYRQWYLDNFEWSALTHAMEWRQVETTRGKPNWENADGAMKILNDNGKKVRGHAIFEAPAERVLDWVKSLDSRIELYVMCMKRAAQAVSHFKGRLEHWDVYNEMMAGSFFENKYGSTSITHDMFKKSKEVDPNVKLFLNDYNVISGGSNLQKYIDMVIEFRIAEVPLDGIGVQGHFSGRPQASTVKDRLDQLATLNLPIWVTELDYAHSDDQERADVLEELLTVFFSHPSVEGILFSEFNSETHWRGLDAALLDGFSIETSQSSKIQRYWPNTAGKMWQRLFHQQWRTNATNKVGNVKQGERESTSVKAFYGDYKVSVSVGGKVVTTRDVIIRKEQGSQHLNMQLNSNGVIG